MKRGYYWLGKKRPELSKRFEGRNNPRFGKQISDEMKTKLSIENSGEKSIFWKGGISKDTKSYKKIRRARILATGGNHTAREWENVKAQYNWTCRYCLLQEPTIKLTKDHIIPVSKGGSDNIENIQPLCGKCNSKKGTKII